VGDIFKKGATLNIFDPLMHHWGQGAFDSSKRGKKGVFKDVAGQGKGMTAQQRADFKKRQAGKLSNTDALGPQTPLSSTYS
jgi:hypothetical protein